MATYSFYSDSLQWYLEKDSQAIDGWLHTVAKFIIPIINSAQRDIGLKGDILEIGVWHGLSLLMFDYLSEPGELVEGYDLVLQPTLKSNVAKFGSPRIALHQADSTRLTIQGLSEKRANEIRLFHIDGYHTFDVAYNDLRLSVNATASKGVVILDDFFSPTVPGVTEALYSLIYQKENNDFLPFALGGGKLYLCHEKMIDLYRSVLFDRMPMPSKNGKDVDLMFGNKVAVYDLW